VDEGIDTGDIILQKEFSIGHKDTIGKAVRQSLKIFPQMLVEALVKIESGKYKRIKQNKRKGKYWKKRQPKDGLIDWSKMTAIQIYNFVRALTKP